MKSARFDGVFFIEFWPAIALVRPTSFHRPAQLEESAPDIEGASEGVEVASDAHEFMLFI